LCIIGADDDVCRPHRKINSFSKSVLFDILTEHHGKLFANLINA